MNLESILSEDTEDDEQPKKRGRPRRGKKVTQVTKREFIEPEDEPNTTANTEEDMPPLFSTGEVEERSVVRIRVHRKDPNEGMLGYLEDSTASEQEIFERWGGGQFRIEGLNTGGRIVIARTIKLAGDPIFVSETYAAQYRRTRGLPMHPQQTATPGMSLQDMLMFMREQEGFRLKAEEDRQTRERHERREHEERMRRLEVEAEAKRRKDEQERDDRRRKDDSEREERRRRDSAEAEQRSATFMQSMLAATKQSADQAIAFVRQTSSNNGGPNQMMDAVKMVVAIKSAFAGDGGGEDEANMDPLKMLIKHGPNWLQGLGGAVTGALREWKGGGAPVEQQQQPGQPRQLPAATAQGLTIPADSPLASKLQVLVTKIAEKGQDPEKVLSVIVDNMVATIDGNPPPMMNAPAPAPAPAPVPPAAPVAAAPEVPAPNGASKPAKPMTVEKTAAGSLKMSFGA